MRDEILASLDVTLPEGRTTKLRLRAAYLYHVEGLTQNEVADRLGVGRVTVVRLLNEARDNREVRFWIEGELADCVALEIRLEKVLALERAIVTPAAADDASRRRLIGFATGIQLAEMLADGMCVGLGWGRTLHHALATLPRLNLQGVSVVSLLGGIYHAREHNPSEFAWQVASMLRADCHLFTAPAVVDSAETKRALMERCGLDALVRRAQDLDLALVSVGAMDADATTFRFAQEMLRPELLDELVAAGAVGDLFFNFFDASGRAVEHPINARIMSVPLDCVRSARRRVLASGGLLKTEAIIAACRMIAASMLITDETTATAILRTLEPAG